MKDRDVRGAVEDDTEEPKGPDDKNKGLISSPLRIASLTRRL